MMFNKFREVNHDTATFIDNEIVERKLMMKRLIKILIYILSVALIVFAGIFAGQEISKQCIMKEQAANAAVDMTAPAPEVKSMTFTVNPQVTEVEMDMLAARYWSGNPNYKARYSLQDTRLENAVFTMEESLYCFNPDGSATVLCNGDGAAGSLYSEEYITSDFGNTWTFKGYLRSGDIYHYTDQVFSFKNNRYLFLAQRPWQPEEQCGVLCLYIDNIDEASAYYSEMIPGYEPEKDVRISSVVMTQENTFVISFFDAADNSFYFSGIYDIELQLIAELTPVKAS